MKAKRILSFVTAMSTVLSLGVTAPVESSSSLTTQAAKTLWGDANESGGVNVADAVAVLQYIANRSKYPLTEQGFRVEF